MFSDKCICINEAAATRTPPNSHETNFVRIIRRRFQIAPNTGRNLAGYASIIKRHGSRGSERADLSPLAPSSAGADARARALIWTAKRRQFVARERPRVINRIDIRDCCSHELRPFQPDLILFIARRLHIARRWLYIQMRRAPDV